MSTQEGSWSKKDKNSASFRASGDLKRHILSVHEGKPIPMFSLLLCLFTKIHFEDTCGFSS